MLRFFKFFKFFKLIIFFTLIISMLAILIYSEKNLDTVWRVIDIYFRYQSTSLYNMYIKFKDDFSLYRLQNLVEKLTETNKNTLEELKNTLEELKITKHELFRVNERNKPLIPERVLNIWLLICFLLFLYKLLGYYIYKYLHMYNNVFVRFLRFIFLKKSVNKINLTPIKDLNLDTNVFFDRHKNINIAAIEKLPDTNDIDQNLNNLEEKIKIISKKSLIDSFIIIIVLSFLQVLINQGNVFNEQLISLDLFSNILQVQDEMNNKLIDDFQSNKSLFVSTEEHLNFLERLSNSLRNTTDTLLNFLYQKERLSVAFELQKLIFFVKNIPDILDSNYWFELIGFLDNLVLKTNDGHNIADIDILQQLDSTEEVNCFFSKDVLVKYKNLREVLICQANITY